MGINFKNMFGRMKRDEKKIGQPESIQKTFEAAFNQAAHEYIMSLPHSYFLRKGPNGKKR